MKLIHTIRDFSGLDEKSVDHLAWAEKHLHNCGKQYSICSHLNAKTDASEDLSDQSPSLVRQFLSQTEPPERFVNVEPVTQQESELRDEEEIDEDEDGDEDEEDDIVDVSGIFVRTDFI